ncbi:MAG: hypothetical protein J5669_04225 [Bacteroidales bacterium]|nr:hypothetical protein [Bacteroidales bacterium]
MKKFFTLVCALASFAVLAQAQPQSQPPVQKDELEARREQIRAEQKELIQKELELTESESKAFWPVYDQVQDKRREAYGKLHHSFKALNKRVRDGEKVDKSLDEYLSAKEKCDKVNKDAVKRYKKVLPTEKVARLLLAEERFRHDQIGERGGNKSGKHQFGPQGKPGAPGAPGAHAAPGRLPKPGASAPKVKK